MWAGNAANSAPQLAARQWILSLTPIIGVGLLFLGSRRNRPIITSADRLARPRGNVDHSELGPQLDVGQRAATAPYREPDAESQRAAWEREAALAGLWVAALTRAARGEAAAVAWGGRTYEAKADPAALKAWRALSARLAAKLAAPQ